MTVTVNPNFFGMSILAYDYNFGYEGGPNELWPTSLGLLEPSVVRSLNVWSPGDGAIQYLSWGALEPSQGTYNWTSLQSWISTNQSKGVPMMFTFNDIPSWAGNVNDVNLPAFQQFVTALVNEAGGSIKYWEGFNEFNDNGMPPATAVQLQEIIYNTVHSLDPGALVLSPTVNSYGADGTYGQFLADGGGKYFDIAAFHGYGNATGEGLATSVTDLQSLLSQYGLSSKPIWDTEWGLWGQNLSTTAQEAFISTGLIVQADLGVQTQVFYAYDLGGNQTLYNQSTGKLTSAGIAYKTTEQWLHGATLGSYTDKNGIYTLPITESSGQSGELVWDASGSAKFTAPSQYGHYETVLGQTDTISQHVMTIGITPDLLLH